MKPNDESSSSSSMNYYNISWSQVVNNYFTGPENMVPNNENKDINKVKVTENKDKDFKKIEKKEILNIYFSIDFRTLRIESEKGDKFGEAIDELYRKYGWLRKKNIIDFVLNGKKLDKNLTIQENNITNNAKINIIII